LPGGCLVDEQEAHDVGDHHDGQHAEDAAIAEEVDQAGGDAGADGDGNRGEGMALTWHPIVQARLTRSTLSVKTKVGPADVTGYQAQGLAIHVDVNGCGWGVSHVASGLAIIDQSWLRAGYNVVLNECQADSLASSKENFPSVQMLIGSIGEVDIPGKFDIVTLFNVDYALDDSKFTAALANLRGALAEGGIILNLTVNTLTVRAVLAETVKRWLLRQVDLFLVHMKDVRAWEECYGIPARRPPAGGHWSRPADRTIPGVNGRSAGCCPSCSPGSWSRPWPERRIRPPRSRSCSSACWSAG